MFFKEFAQQYAQQHHVTLNSQAQVLILQRENEFMKSRIASLSAELKQWTIIHTSLYKSFQEIFDFAKQNTALHKRISQLESEIDSTREQAAGSRAEIEYQLEKAKLEHALESKTNANLQATRTEPRPQRSEDAYQAEIEHLTAMKDGIERNCELRLEILDVTLEEKTQALVASKREIALLNQTHEQHSHKLRMKYEEQLLKIVQASSESEQVELFRKRLIVQKQESDTEIAALKKRLSRFE